MSICLTKTVAAEAKYDARILTPSYECGIKSLQIFSVYRMEFAAILYFLRKAQKCIFTIKAPFCEENKGESEGVRVSGGDLKMRSILKH